MGLDIYLHAIKKLEPERVAELEGKPYGEVCGMRGIMVHDDCRLADGIRDMCDKVELVTRYLDEERVKADHGIPGDARRDGRAQGPGARVDLWYWSEEEGKAYEAHLAGEKLEEYVVETPESYLVCARRDIGYWRKDYDIQDAAYEYIDGVENCGTYIVGTDLLEEFARIDPDFEVPELAEGEVAAYHEWY